MNEFGPVPGAFFNPDLDNHVVAVGNFTQPAAQPPTVNDLLWRHQTDGRLGVGKMSGSDFLAQYHVSPQPFDIQYRTAGQDTTDSTWRLTRVPPRYVRVTVTTSPSLRIDLTLNSENSFLR
jgi:hypothetical protein